MKVRGDFSPTIFAPLLFDCRIIVVVHVMVTLTAPVVSYATWIGRKTLICGPFRFLKIIT